MKASDTTPVALDEDLVFIKKSDLEKIATLCKAHGIFEELQALGVTVAPVIHEEPIRECDDRVVRVGDVWVHGPSDYHAIDDIYYERGGVYAIDVEGRRAILIAEDGTPVYDGWRLVRRATDRAAGPSGGSITHPGT